MPRGRTIYNDGVSNSTTTYTSATAAFVSADVGLPITGTNIPAGTTIASRTNATTILLSQAATGTASGLTFTIATIVPILPKVGTLPLAYEFTPDTYRALLLQRLTLQLSGASLILGSHTAHSSSAPPKRDIGPVLFTDTYCWMAWNNLRAQYEPMEIGFMNGTVGMTVNAAPTAARTLTLPDATGTAIIKTDVSVPKETVVLSSTGGTVSAIDADVSSDFILTLTENSTIPSLSNMASGSGKRIKIAIVNEGTAYTVTWPSSGANEIKWPSSPSHTQPVSTPSQPTALAIYTISEANVGITAHLWGDPEVSGFAGPSDVATGGEIPDEYHDADLPPPKGIRPFDTP